MKALFKANLSKEDRLQLLDTKCLDEWIDVSEEIDSVHNFYLLGNDYKWIKELSDANDAADDIEIAMTHLAMEIKLKEYIRTNYPKFSIIEIQLWFDGDEMMNISGELGLFSGDDRKVW